MDSTIVIFIITIFQNILDCHGANLRDQLVRYLRRNLEEGASQLSRRNLEDLRYRLHNYSPRKSYDSDEKEASVNDVSKTHNSTKPTLLSFLKPLLKVFFPSALKLFKRTNDLDRAEFADVRRYDDDLGDEDLRQYVNRRNDDDDDEGDDDYRLVRSGRNVDDDDDADDDYRLVRSRRNFDDDDDGDDDYRIIRSRRNVDDDDDGDDDYRLIRSRRSFDDDEESKYSYQAQLFRRLYDFHPGMKQTIIGTPTMPGHLPEAEAILPGHTLIRPALGMLKSAVKFPHKDLDNGAGVYGNIDSLGITWDGTGERVLYTGFRRSNELDEKNTFLEDGEEEEQPRYVIALLRSGSPMQTKPISRVIKDYHKIELEMDRLREERKKQLQSGAVQKQEAYKPMNPNHLKPHTVEINGLILKFVDSPYKHGKKNNNYLRYLESRLTTSKPNYPEMSTPGSNDGLSMGKHKKMGVIQREQKELQMDLQQIKNQLKKTYGHKLYERAEDYGRNTFERRETYGRPRYERPEIYGAYNYERPETYGRNQYERPEMSQTYNGENRYERQTYNGENRYEKPENNQIYQRPTEKVESVVRGVKAYLRERELI